MQATEYHLGQLKAKLAKLRTELQAPASGGKGGGEGFEVQKYGDGRVALIGGLPGAPFVISMHAQGVLLSSANVIGIKSFCP